MKRPFRISYRVIDAVEVIVVEVSDGKLCGRGEAIGVNYHDETAQSIHAEVEAVADEIDGATSRAALAEILGPGGARNAVDCALWDLECKREGRSIWQKLGITPRELSTVYTIGIDDPAAMRANAAGSREAMLKIKVDSLDPVGQVEAVREGRPDARLVVDANQAFDLAQLREVIAPYARLGVEMLEQPLPAGKDEELAGFSSSIPLGADESCIISTDVSYVAQRYQVANIKLDKTGGLTEALALRDTALAAGLDLMVGCMAGTSLSMAPAYVIGQTCRFVDIDGPLLQKEDREHAMEYKAGVVSIPTPALWG